MDTSNAGAAKVTILSGHSNVGAEIAINRDEAFIGRQPGCEVLLDHPTVSGKHARLYRRDGVFYVEDLNSTNGTAVNGLAISGSVAVKSGDLVQVGEVHVLFQQEAADFEIGRPAGFDNAGATWVAPGTADAFPVTPAGQTVDAGAGAVTSVLASEQSGVAGAGLSAQTQADVPSLDSAGQAAGGWSAGTAWGDASAKASEGASASSAEEAGANGALESPVEGPPAVSSARVQLEAIAGRTLELEHSLQSLGESVGQLEQQLADTVQSRDELNLRFRSLLLAVRGAIDESTERSKSLGVDAVLTNLDGLEVQPNDLALLVNVSRDAGKYASLVRLNSELVGQLNTILSDAGS